MPVYKTKKGKWIARYAYTDQDGKYTSIRSKQFDTKSEASKRLAEMQLEHQNAHSRLTFDDAFKEYMDDQKNKVKPTTYSHYPALYDHIKPMLGKVAVERLTIPQYKAFKKSLDEKVVRTKNADGESAEVLMSTSRKNRCHRFVKTLCDVAYKNHGIRNDVPDRVGGFRDPINLEPDEEEIVIITEDQFRQFLEYIDGNDFKALFMVLFYQGTRSSGINLE